MFIDDEKMKSRKSRDGRAVFYITITALAACVLMFVGLMNFAHAEGFDRARMVLTGDIGETRLYLDLERAIEPIAETVVDPMTTSSTHNLGYETSIDRRLSTALGLGAFIFVAGLSQMISRGVERDPAPRARWHSEA